MSVLPILRMGHPILRQQARPLTEAEILSPIVSQLVADMYDTMKDAGGIGLAAPQIGLSIQLAIIEVPKESTKYPYPVDDHGLKVICNPQLQITDSSLMGYWEGCLSVPGLRGYVERPQGIQVQYLDRQAQSQVLQAHGFLATVVQHELDHLFGVLYIDKIKDSKLLAYVEEYQQFVLTEQTAELD